MAMRLVKTALETPKRKPQKSKDYLGFLHRLPCAVTGRYGVEAAHLSAAATHLGHYGRGKQSKASDRWALPLSPEEHRLQHSGNEMAYWEAAGINPHTLALTIWGMWSEMGDDAEPYAIAVINQTLATAGRLRDRSQA